MTAGTRSRLPTLPPGPAVRPTRAGLALACSASLLLAASCGGGDPVQPGPVSPEEEERIKAALQDRSFRQFDPSVDASPRKALVLDFFEGVSLWPSTPRTSTPSTSGRSRRGTTAWRRPAAPSSRRRSS